MRRKPPNLDEGPSPTLVSYNGKLHMLMFDQAVGLVGAWYPLMCDSSTYAQDEDVRNPDMTLPRCEKCNAVASEAILRSLTPHEVLMKSYFGSVVADDKGEQT